mgnify:CR=1 FL=1
MPTKKMSKRLKELFERPEIAVVPGGSTPFHAVLAEKAGYEAFYMSGGNTSAWLLGWPDVGLTTMREVVDNAARIVRAVNIPVFADADTGYGTAVNTWRTVREYIWAGVAGVHIEDQEFPKKSGTMAGRRVVPVEEAVGKFRAAVDAKKDLDPDFVICARTDARGAENGSLEEAIRRANIYKREAGVDVLFLEGLQSWEECKVALREVPGPAFCLLHEVIDPHPSLQEQEAAGQAIALYVRLQLDPANQAAWEMLKDFKERGVQALEDWKARLKSKQWVLPPNVVLLDADRVRRLEEQFLPKYLQRDYERTLGRTPEGGLNRPAS